MLYGGSKLRWSPTSRTCDGKTREGMQLDDLARAFALQIADDDDNHAAVAKLWVLRGAMGIRGGIQVIGSNHILFAMHPIN